MLLREQAVFLGQFMAELFGIPEKDGLETEPLGGIDVHRGIIDE